MRERKSGILMHVTSLPSCFGIGDLGPEAYRFADFLHDSGQRIWQILPLNPTKTALGNSPYSSPSAFAGNTQLISPDLLVQEGFVARMDVDDGPKFSEKRVEYQAVRKYKNTLFSKSFSHFVQKGEHADAFAAFCEEHAYWLHDYAVFEALNERFGGVRWNRWPEDIRDRKKESLKACEKELGTRIEELQFLQYLFYRQWSSLKRYCNEKDIQIIGDLPLYVSYQSADVWAHPEIFKLDEGKTPSVVAGVPPDYFSDTGQLWNNPIYRWDVLKNRGYSWWMNRIRHNLNLFDTVRLDHFRGFEGFWEVHSTHRTAEKGSWVEGPGEDFFDALGRHFPSLPFIAEDLGEITPEVLELRDKYGLPGMRVLQFAFSEDPSSNIHKPHNYSVNCVAFTGTHDNNTLTGWLCEKHGSSAGSKTRIAAERKRALEYIGKKCARAKRVHWEFIRIVMMSVASVVVFPMQDVVGPGKNARMNHPGKPYGNWEWRLLSKKLTNALSAHLREMSELYGRC